MTFLLSNPTPKSLSKTAQRLRHVAEEAPTATRLAQERRFVARYLVHLNAAKAVEEVGGYSLRRARQLGYELLQRPRVQAMIEEAEAELAKRTGIQQEDVIRENQRLAFTDIRDFLEVTLEGVRIKPSSEWTDDQARAVASVREMIHAGGQTTMDLRLHDKQKALAEIAARLWPVPKEPEQPRAITVRVVYEGEQGKSGVEVKVE